MIRKNSALGGRIQQCRRALGLSQEELAHLTGVSRQSVTKWETGQSVPDLARLVVLADVLGASLDFLLRDAPPSQTAGAAPFAAPRPGEEAAAGSEAARADGSEGARLPGPPASGGTDESASDASPSPCRRTAPESAPAPEIPAGHVPAGGAGGRAPRRCPVRRIAATCGAVSAGIGLSGLLALWVLSEAYPVRLADWDGTLYTGVWGFVLVHGLRRVFWAACGLSASGAALLAGAWAATRRVRPADTGARDR